jgi:sterol desaturase/sphingolipid hydroxylase (fatty acid hydroxylase superfamily)
VLQAYWQKLLEALASPFERFIFFPSGFHVLYLGLTFLLCAAIYAKRARRPLRWRTMRRFMLPRRIFLHPSAILDYKYFFITTILRGTMFSGMVISSGLMASGATKALTLVFGASNPITAPYWFLVALTTISEVLLFDLGYWFAHRTMHEIPLLWEFHKPHHAAEVLTPITSARSHPVDDFLQTNFIAIALGFGYGVLVYVFGQPAQPLSLLGMNIVFFAYFLTVFHLRHSHVWLPIRGWLGYIIQSPAHHQIHHSTLTRHHGKNLGFCLSLWDWLFGTLYVPDKREEIEFGIGPEGADFTTLLDLYFRPLEKIRRLWGASAAPAVVDVKREA